MCAYCIFNLLRSREKRRFFICTNIKTSAQLCLTAKLRGLQAARLHLAADWGRYRLVRPWSVSSRPHLLCFDLEHLSARSLSPAKICVRLRGELCEMLIGGAASRGLSAPVHRSAHHQVNNLFFFVHRPWTCPCLRSLCSKGSNIHFKLVGSRIIPGNLKWLFYARSAVISIHSGSVIAFFVAQLTLSLISESSVKLSNLTGRLCAWQRRRPRGSLRWPHGLTHTQKNILLSGRGGTALHRSAAADAASKRLLGSEKQLAQVHWITSPRVVQFESKWLVKLWIVMPLQDRDCCFKRLFTGGRISRVLFQRHTGWKRLLLCVRLIKVVSVIDYQTSQWRAPMSHSRCHQLICPVFFF